MQAAIVATNPSTQRHLCTAFDTADPWALAGLNPPDGGPHVRSAAALAHSRMPGRLARRLPSVRVAVVLESPMVQCNNHFLENTTSGAEWRPMQLAISHALALDDESQSIEESGAVIDGYFPQFAYVSLADHQRWLPRWVETFGEDLIVVPDDNAESVVSALEDHFGRSVDRSGLTGTIGADGVAEPEGQLWDWIRGQLSA